MMAGTRASTQANGDSDSGKRKAEDSPASKNAKVAKTEDGQKTLDETFANGKKDDQDQQLDGANDQNSSSDSKEKDQIGGANDDPDQALKETRDGKGLNTVDSKTFEKKDIPHDDVHAQQDDKSKPAEPFTDTNGGAIEDDKQREEALPSNVLEKGIIYFFTRGRVGIEDIESVTDIQRSYFVLRPLPDGGKITDGAMDDLKNNRLIALPKKVWPKSGKDKFMAFIESAQVSNKDLKENFFQGSEYQTKTVGTRQTPPVTPVGEGVYAITSTGNRGETHLAYMLTVPKEPGELQADMGVASKSSFILSLKNPEVKGPANASLPQKPDFPKEFIEEFNNRSWMPVAPKHLDYPNAQMLMIGEDFESGHALEQTKKDENDDKKESPEEELEKLEHEDQIRINNLKGDDTIFDDLGISKKDYPDVATTW
ncbi:hypothetical protein BDZ85DRAFT_299655 [Elsinoe ampelina]|uniref:BTB domain transcription factor n=1 Tax=Elsinoe ampelina TaxID=302913 RepID=A0A6A6FY21_9PEZI|nr:hypothetical protein BDZ85DRAFT_299655 [Elsinoe ampelina]